MEDSLKGYLTMIVVSCIFVMAVTGFMIGFPRGVGVTFTGESGEIYNQINNLSQTSDTDLGVISNQTESGFKDWDITVGFMGSNTQKSTKAGVTSYSKNVFSNVNTIARILFGANSKIVWVIDTLIVLVGITVTLLFIKFLRTGN